MWRGAARAVHLDWKISLIFELWGEFHKSGAAPRVHFCTFKLQTSSLSAFWSRSHGCCWRLAWNFSWSREISHITWHTPWLPAWFRLNVKSLLAVCMCSAMLTGRIGAAHTTALLSYYYSVIYLLRRPEETSTWMRLRGTPVFLVRMRNICFDIAEPALIWTNYSNCNWDSLNFNLKIKIKLKRKKYSGSLFKDYTRIKPTTIFGGMMRLLKEGISDKVKCKEGYIS